MLQYQDKVVPITFIVYLSSKGKGVDQATHTIKNYRFLNGVLQIFRKHLPQVWGASELFIAALSSRNVGG